MVEIVEKDVWGSRGFWGSKTAANKDVDYFVIHHSVHDITDQTPIQQIQTIEDIIFNRGGFSAFAYNFGMSSDATIFKGRGWLYRNGANSPHNYNSFSCVLAGNYEPNVGNLPTNVVSGEQIDALAELVMDGRKRGFLSQTCTITGHGLLSGARTACPGDNIEAILPWVNIAVIVKTKELENAKTAQEEANKALRAIAEFIKAVKASGTEGIVGKDGKIYVWGDDGIMEKPLTPPTPPIPPPTPPTPPPTPTPPPVTPTPPPVIPDPEPEPVEDDDDLTKEEISFLRRIIEWFKSWR